MRADPELKLGAAPILSPEQYKLQLETWNDTAKPLPDETVVSAFERQVRATPDATAVVFGDESLTYRELDARADGLAAKLRTLGVGPDVIVGLCVERGAEMVIGMLGIQKAGGAYLPLDPNYPADRIDYMLEDAEAPVLVTEPSLESRFQGGPSAIVLLTDGEELGDSAGVAAEASNLAYVIYTSGSTGKPKAVMVEHRNAINFFIAMDEYVEKGEDATWLAVTSLSFDISVLEILYALHARVQGCGARGRRAAVGGIRRQHECGQAARLQHVLFLGRPGRGPAKQVPAVDRGCEVCR